MNTFKTREIKANVLIRGAIISILLLLFCVVSTAPVLAATAKQPSEWAKDAVNEAIAQGLVPKNLQSQYTQPATRAEFCALVVAFYEFITDSEITERVKFDDTNDINVEKAASIGVVYGMGDNKFAPHAKLNRQQAAAMLSRLASAIDKPLPLVYPDFADKDMLEAWAYYEVGGVQEAGIMQGVGDNAFAPLNPYTREQCILTIMRLYKEYEVVYTDEYVVVYTKDGGTINVFSDPIWSEIATYNENIKTGYSEGWYYTSHGAFVGGDYVGDYDYMPIYRYKDGVFEKFYKTVRIIDFEFVGDYLYIILGRIMGDYMWYGQGSSNIVQVSLIDESERYLGLPDFVYGWSNDRIYNVEDWEGWEIREDGIYVFGFCQNPEDNTQEQSGFYLVDLNGNGHQLVKLR